MTHADTKVVVKTWISAAERAKLDKRAAGEGRSRAAHVALLIRRDLHERKP